MKKAFTLVELIVVITILAILATIGFVSFSGYLAWARDTNRVAQLKSMSDALELYSTKKSLPIPDDKVDIKASSKTIAYQGYIWKNVLETIEYTESWLDPKDKNYFSYYLTRNKKYFQLLAFLEEESEDTLASIKIWVHNVQATDYTDRFPKVTGKKLWILLDSDKNPVQENSVITASWYLDVAGTLNSYTAIFDSSTKISGTGGVILSSMAMKNENLSILDSSLVVYYDFNDSHLKEKSANNFSAIFAWGAKLEKTDNLGVKSAYFSWDNADYISLWTPVILSSWLTDFSVSVWTKLWIKHGNRSYNYHIFGNEVYQSYGLLWRIEDTTNSNTSGRIQLRTSTSWTATSIQSLPWSYPNDQKWHHLVFIKKWTIGKIYVDWNEISYGTQQVMNNYAASLKKFAIWGHRWEAVSQAFNGNLDNFRLYSRWLTEGEIEILYSKKPK